MRSDFFKIFNYLVIISSFFTGLIVFAVLSSVLFIVNNLEFIIPYFIFATILSVFIITFSYVIFSIPFKLAVKFDLIKNDIASGKLTDINEVQQSIAEFCVQFFHYVGADIVGAKIHFKGSNYPATVKCSIDIDSISIEEISKKRVVRINKHKVFYIPVIFEDEKLGYMILISRGYSYPFFYKILEYFEEYFIDDQVKCLTRKVLVNK